MRGTAEQWSMCTRGNAIDMNDPSALHQWWQSRAPSLSQERVLFLIPQPTSGGDVERFFLTVWPRGLLPAGTQPQGRGGGAMDPKMVVQINGFCGHRGFCFRHLAAWPPTSKSKNPLLVRDGPLKWPHRRVGVLIRNSRGHTKAWENFARRARRANVLPKAWEERRKERAHYVTIGAQEPKSGQSGDTTPAVSGVPNAQCGG